MPREKDRLGHLIAVDYPARLLCLTQLKADVGVLPLPAFSRLCSGRCTWMLIVVCQLLCSATNRHLTLSGYVDLTHTIASK